MPARPLRLPAAEWFAEPAVSAFRVPSTFLFIFALVLALAFDHEGIVGDFDLYIFRPQPGSSAQTTNSLSRSDTSTVGAQLASPPPAAIGQDGQRPRQKCGPSRHACDAWQRKGY